MKPLPGPTNSFLGLSFFQRMRSEPLVFASELAQTYGDIASFRIGPVRMCLVNHPDLIRQVLVTKGKSFRKSPYQTRVFKQVDGEGLIISEGDFWLRQRRLVQPALHPKRMRHYAAAVVEQARRLADSWTEGETLCMDVEMKKLSLRVICQTMFDVDVAEEAEILGEAVGVLSEIFTKEFSAPVLLPDWLPLPGKRRKRQAIATLDTTIRRIIAERRAAGDDKGDLLSMLLLAIDEEGDGKGMSDEQARDEAMTLFNAGHDTTAASLTWLWYVLNQHPNVLQRVLAEIDHVLGERAATYEDLPRLVYTACVVQETLRLYPPTWGLFARVAQEAVPLGNYDIPKGTWMLIFPFVTQRDERFFPDPETFDPERFSAERVEQIPKYAYLPFGAGPHVCIGKSFSLMEMTLAVPTILQRVRLSRKPGHHAIEFEPLVALRPKKGLWMTIQRERDGLP